MALTIAATRSDWVPTDTFGARLALIRNMLGMNIKQIAEHCGFPDSTWDRWEKGIATPRNLTQVVQKISLATGVKRDWLAWGGPLDQLSVSLMQAFRDELRNTGFDVRTGYGDRPQA